MYHFLPFYVHMMFRLLLCVQHCCNIVCSPDGSTPIRDRYHGHCLRPIRIILTSMAKYGSWPHLESWRLPSLSPLDQLFELEQKM